MSYSKYDGRGDRYRVDSRRDGDSHRRSSSGPNRGRSPPPDVKPVIKKRDDDELPLEFGRLTEPTAKEDENTVLKRMKSAFTHSPLKEFNECILRNKKVKIWTRNFEEVRGVCTGYVIAFDKHWNLVLTDVDEVFLKPKKAKTPFLLDAETTDLKELPPKTPRVKKAKAPEEEVVQKPAEEPAKKKPKKKKQKKRGYSQRHLKQVLIRGDNIVMCAILE